MAAPRVMVPILCLCAAVFCLGLWTSAGNAYESPSPLDVSTPASSSMSFGVARDSWINADAVTANYGADKELWVGLYNQAGKTYERRALLYFDISGLPADAIVDSAGLELSQVAAYDAAQLNIWPYQVVDYWDEASVTWSDSPPLASTGDPATTVDKSSGVKVWDVTKIVQSWRAGAKNYGILLAGDGKTLGHARFRFPRILSRPPHRLLSSSLDAGRTHAERRRICRDPGGLWAQSGRGAHDRRLDSPRHHSTRAVRRSRPRTATRDTGWACSMTNWSSGWAAKL